jgi:cysteine desulfuration protein SufE
LNHNSGQHIILKEKMNNSTNKEDAVKKLFSSCRSAEERYELIISLGKNLPVLNPIYKIPQNLVDGCQSKLYLHAIFINNTIHFECDSDALISKGLGAILLLLYNDESPEFIITHKPIILSELNIFSSLSETRSHGLKSLFLKMQKIALQYLV